MNNNFNRKYLKYKSKYINLKKNMLGGATCSEYLQQLKEKTKTLAINNGISEDNLDKHINDFFDGVSDKDTPLKKLLDPIEPSLSKPLWWAGFNLSDNDVKNKFENFIKENKVYSNTNTKYSEVTNSPLFIDTESNCAKTKEFNNMMSSLSYVFTLNSLDRIDNISKDNILRCTLLVNKETEGNDRLLKDSYFYGVEFPIIMKYCINKGKKCVIYIHNLKPNCGNIKSLLLEKAKEIINIETNVKEPLVRKYFNAICVKI